MARSIKQRIIQKAPGFKGFKPVGSQKNGHCEVILSFEEYEAIKLCDYDLLTHAEAATMMNVSRPTFTRVYESARRKIAKAFVEESSICIKGGNVAMDTLWLRCGHCKITFSLIDGTPRSCPICQSTDILENN